MTSDSFFKSLLKLTFVIFCASIFFSCTFLPSRRAIKSCSDFPFDPVGPNITASVLLKYPLTYSSVIKDNKNQPFIRIDYKYIGRCPDLTLYEEPNDPYIGPNYNVIRISFYNQSVVNLTDSPIIIKRATTRQLFQDYWLRHEVDKKGNKEIVKVPAVTFRDYSEKPSRRGNVIEPHEVRDSGSWCYSGGGEVWLNELIVEFKGEEYTINFHRVGH